MPVSGHAERRFPQLLPCACGRGSRHTFASLKPHCCAAGWAGTASVRQPGAHNGVRDDRGRVGSGLGHGRLTSNREWINHDPPLADSPSPHTCPGRSTGRGIGVIPTGSSGTARSSRRRHTRGGHPIVGAPVFSIRQSRSRGGIRPGCKKPVAVLSKTRTRTGYSSQSTASRALIVASSDRPSTSRTPSGSPHRTLSSLAAGTCGARVAVTRSGSRLGLSSHR